MPELKTIYADLHVHLGSTTLGNPVKITASKNLTFANIMAECAYRKGIDLVGIVDAVTPEALADAAALLATGDLVPLAGGGLRYQDRTTVLLGAEIEVTHRGRPVHWVAYLPTIEAMRDFSDALGRTIKNRTLSTQRSRWTASDLVQAARERGGLVFPAHAFTPFKSLFAAAYSLTEILGDAAAFIEATELGLSADTAMADQLPELWSRTFITDSDAHSLAKIAREYNELSLEEASFAEFQHALRRSAGRHVQANYGLDPRLGKYHRTFCLVCDAVVTDPPPSFACPRCGSQKIVMGVVDRLLHLHRLAEPDAGAPPARPPYHYQVPLEFVPGIGPAASVRLLAAFGSEMAVLHRATEADLTEAVGGKLASRIAQAREGKLAMEVGGGGHYGRVQLPT
ncbi:MAG: endonuclease Q family protein [Symbiobacteriia bacterium]